MQGGGFDMAGREYKARDKSVQKMSRDGLVEENLRTGRSHRAATGRIDAVRIGDRPMESLAEDAAGHRKRIHRAGESSFREAPSSLDGNTLDTDFVEVLGPEPEDTSGDSRMSDRLQQDTYRTALHRGWGVFSDSYDGRGALGGRQYERGSRKGYEKDARRQHRDQYAYRRREGEGSTGTYEPHVNEPLSPGSLTETENTENALVTSQNAASGYETYPESDPGKAAEESSGASVAEPHHRQQIRGHPYSAAREAALYADGLRQEGTKSHSDLFGEATSQRGSRLRETSSEFDGLDAFREEIRSKRKKERLNQEQRRARDASRISFDDEGGMVQGSGMGFSRHAKSGAEGSGSAGGRIGRDIAGNAAGAAGKTAGMAAAFSRAKLSEAADEDDNAGTQAAIYAGSVMDNSVRALASRGSRYSGRRRSASRRKGSGRGSARLLFTEEEVLKGAAGKAKTEKEKKAAVKNFFKKQRQRRMIAAARKEEKTIASVFRGQQTAVERAATIVRDAIVRSRSALIVIGAVIGVFLLISASLGSCGALVQGIGNSVISTTYPSTDEEIYAVENRYRELEAGLDSQIRRMQETHPTYDEFRFQIDEISHNPYHLISYFTAKYGQFTYEQVKDEIEEIFREQYSLTTSGEQGVTITETRTVHPGESLGDVTTSGYCSCEICCGPWAGGTTASGTYPMSNHTIAVDAYNPFVPIGAHVIMNGIEYVVEDTGAFDRFGVQFDVYYDDHQSALAHGHQVCEAVLAEGGGIEELELTTTRTVDRMSVVLTNHDLDTVLQNRLTVEEKVRYGLYNVTFGNRNYLFDLNNLPRYGNASKDYTIPPEALSDERFARMIAEAERHLGTPYVWGGYAPGGFDCSGFVCWVINHCGNGWNIGRTTAEGIRQYCAYVSPEDARPGDIIFFENTYSCAGASHVGIYVGDGMMIHCGEPVQYTSINTSYWQDHFMEFGRIP